MRLESQILEKDEHVWKSEKIIEQYIMQNSMKRGFITHRQNSQEIHGFTKKKTPHLREQYSYRSWLGSWNNSINHQCMCLHQRCLIFLCLHQRFPFGMMMSCLKKTGLEDNKNATAGSWKLKKPCAKSDFDIYCGSQDLFVLCFCQLSGKPDVFWISLWFIDAGTRISRWFWSWLWMMTRWARGVVALEMDG